MGILVWGSTHASPWESNKSFSAPHCLLLLPVPQLSSCRDALPRALLVQVVPPPVQWPGWKSSHLSSTLEHGPRTNYATLIQHENRYSQSPLIGKIPDRPNSILKILQAGLQQMHSVMGHHPGTTQQRLSCTALLIPVETTLCAQEGRSQLQRLGRSKQMAQNQVNLKLMAMLRNKQLTACLIFGIWAVKCYHSEHCITLIKFCGVSTRVLFVHNVEKPILATVICCVAAFVVLVCLVQ